MPQYELNFQDYLRIFRKRRILIGSAFLISLVLTVFYTKMQPVVFQTSATVRYEQKKTVIGALVEEMYFRPGNPLDTEINVIQSRKVAEKAAKRLGFVDEKMSDNEKKAVISDIQGSIFAEKLKDTNIINISVTGSDPKKITRIANMAVQVYIDENLNQKRREATETRQFVQERLAAVEKELNQAEEKLKAFKERESVTGVAIELERRLVELKGRASELLTKATEKHPQIIRLREEISQLEEQNKTLPASELEYARLNRDKEINEQTYRMLREKFEASRIAEAEKTPDVTPINQAIEPSYPIKPNKGLNLIVGSLMGIMLGLIFTFVTESLDTSIGTIEDVEKLINLPVLGIIPSVRLQERENLKKRQKGHFFSLRFRKKETSQTLDFSATCLTVQYHPHLPVSEAYRILRTNLKINPSQKTILFSSTGPREGKTTVLVSLGLIFAQMGTKVVIVDTDLRRPTIARVFGVERDPGLSEVISGTLKLKEALRGLSDILVGKVDISEALKTPGLDNLKILSSGHIPLNPAELLGSTVMSDIIRELKSDFDLVLFDSPPALSISDAVILSPKLDGVVLVYEVGRTARAALLRTKVQLESAGAKMLGVVLNHTQPETEIQSSYYPYYHYKYKYYYSSEDSEDSGKRLTDT
ncbi:MAG: polysaccharide biosynthesis tyrosine autokinase [Candidatus Omnitrophota bacterium]